MNARIGIQDEHWLVQVLSRRIVAVGSANGFQIGEIVPGTQRCQDIRRPGVALPRFDGLGDPLGNREVGGLGPLADSLLQFFIQVDGDLTQIIASRVCSKREMASIELSGELATARKARAAAQGLTLEAWLQEIAAIETPVRPRKRPRYTLKELIRQCDLSVPLTDEDRAWLDAPPVGRESLDLELILCLRLDLVVGLAAYDIRHQLRPVAGSRASLIWALMASTVVISCPLGVLFKS